MRKKPRSSSLTAHASTRSRTSSRRCRSLRGAGAGARAGPWRTAPSRRTSRGRADVASPGDRGTGAGRRRRCPRPGCVRWGAGRPRRPSTPAGSRGSGSARACPRQRARPPAPSTRTHGRAGAWRNRGRNSPLCAVAAQLLSPRSPPRRNLGDPGLGLPNAGFERPRLLGGSGAGPHVTPCCHAGLGLPCCQSRRIDERSQDRAAIYASAFFAVRRAAAQRLQSSRLRRQRRSRAPTTQPRRRSRRRSPLAPRPRSRSTRRASSSSATSPRRARARRRRTRTPSRWRARSGRPSA